VATSDFHAHAVTTIERLEELYSAPKWVSQAKEVDYVTKEYRLFIEAAPFCVLATRGPEGLDCSPRGGLPGFVRVHDENTLLIPDFRGNNRIDSLRNVVRDPHIALLFLIPGCGETLRVIGQAAISADPGLAAGFASCGEIPRTVLIIRVERVYYHCAKSVSRSRLWDASHHIDRRDLPSTNSILAAIQWQNVRRTFRPRNGASASAEMPSETLAPADDEASRDNALLRQARTGSRGTGGS
jgi:uncharacterized protein